MPSPGSWPTSRGQYQRRRHFLAALILISLATIVSEISGLIPVGRAWNITIIVCVSLLLAACVGLHVLYASYVPTRRRLPRPPSNGSVDLKAIRREYARFIGIYNQEQIVQYARSILNPRDLRGRITEEISLQKRTLRQKVTTIVNVPVDHPTKPLLFPAFVPLKGELQDDLTLSVDDKSVVTLTHREYLVITSLVFETFMVPAPGSPLCARDMRKLAEHADTALGLIARRGQLDKSLQKKLDKCANRIAGFAAQAGPSLLLAAALLRKLANSYAVVAAIPYSDNTQKLVVCYERYIIPELSLASKRKPLRATHDRVAALLGARPTRVDLSDFGNAASADSYHLFIMAPEGMYVGWQDMPGLDRILRETNAAQESYEPYVRFQRRRGQRYLHLYMRSIPKEMAERLRLSVRFYEVPPGSMAGATLAAGASFALIFMVALIFSGSKVSPNALGSDFPALVLAFPALVGAFVGFDSRSAGLVGGSFSSMASAFLTVLVSLGAAGLYMADGKWSGTNFQIPGITHVLGVQGVLWQSLTVLSLFNVLYAFYVWITRTASFYWLANRPDD